MSDKTKPVPMIKGVIGTCNHCGSDVYNERPHYCDVKALQAALTRLRAALASAEERVENALQLADGLTHRVDAAEERARGLEREYEARGELLERANRRGDEYLRDLKERTASLAASRAEASTLTATLDGARRRIDELVEASRSEVLRLTAALEQANRERDGAIEELTRYSRQYLIAHVEKAEADLERMRGALAPFAALGVELPKHMPDDRKLYAYGTGEAITAGDVRRARALATPGTEAASTGTLGDSEGQARCWKTDRAVERIRSGEPFYAFMDQRPRVIAYRTGSVIRVLGVEVVTDWTEPLIDPDAPAASTGTGEGKEDDRG